MPAYIAINVSDILPSSASLSPFSYYAMAYLNVIAEMVWKAVCQSSGVHRMKKSFFCSDKVNMFEWKEKLENLKIILQNCGIGCQNLKTVWKSQPSRPFIMTSGSRSRILNHKETGTPSHFLTSVGRFFHPKPPNLKNQPTKSRKLYSKLLEQHKMAPKRFKTDALNGSGTL